MEISNMWMVFLVLVVIESNQKRSGLPKNLVGIGGFRNGFVVSAHLNLTT